MAESISVNLEPFYGREGSSIYRLHAEAIFGAYLSQPELRWWSLQEHGRTLAVVLTRINGGRGEVTLGHRHSAESEGAAEQELVARAVEDMQARGAQCVLAEFMPTSDFAGLDALPPMGFRRFERDFMRCDVLLPQCPRPACIRPITQRDVDTAGECVAAAYGESGERLLHRETHTVEQAALLVHRALAGEFGSTRPGMNIGVWEGGTCVALALGCVLAPGIGFTIQVATRPEAQGKGYARALLHEQHQAFREAHCDAASLAVTVDNCRARGLYERLGYHSHRRFDAYVWYREWPNSRQAPGALDQAAEDSPGVRGSLPASGS